MYTIFKISHLNTAVLDDKTLKEEIESCRKMFTDCYSPLSLWVNVDERNLIFYKRYFNSLLFEYQLRFDTKLPGRFPPIQNSKKFIKLPHLYWYNNKGFIEKIPFEEMSLKCQHDLVERWKTYEPKWTHRWKTMAEVLDFMRGAENDYK